MPQAIEMNKIEVADDNIMSSDEEVNETDIKKM